MRRTTLLVVAAPLVLAACTPVDDVIVGNPCATPLIVSVNGRYAHPPEEYATAVDREVIPPGVAVKVSEQESWEESVFAVWVDEAAFLLNLAYGELPDDKTVWLPESVCPVAATDDRAVVLVESGGGRDGEEPSEVHVVASPTATAELVAVATTLGGADTDVELDEHGVVHVWLWPFRATDYTLDPLLEAIVGQSPSTHLSSCEEDGCVEEVMKRDDDPPPISLPAGERTAEWYELIIGLAVIGGLAFLALLAIRRLWRWYHTRRQESAEPSTGSTDSR